MQLETGTGWSRGLNNLLRSELGRWFGTKQWWVQILIWSSIAVGIPLMAALATSDDEALPMAMLFNAMLGIGGPIGEGAWFSLPWLVVNGGFAGYTAYALTRRV